MQVSKVISRLFHYYYERTFGKETDQLHAVITGNFIWIVLAGLFVIWSLFIVYILKTIVLKKFHEKKIETEICERFKPFELLSPEKLCHLEVYICGVFLLPIRISLIVVTLTFHVVVIKILLILTSKTAKNT